MANGIKRNYMVGGNFYLMTEVTMKGNGAMEKRMDMED